MRDFLKVLKRGSCDRERKRERERNAKQQQETSECKGKRSLLFSGSSQVFFSESVVVISGIDDEEILLFSSQFLYFDDERHSDRVLWVLLSSLSVIAIIPFWVNTSVCTFSSVGYTFISQRLNQKWLLSRLYLYFSTLNQKWFSSNRR